MFAIPFWKNQKFTRNPLCKETGLRLCKGFGRRRI